MFSVNQSHLKQYMCAIDKILCQFIERNNLFFVCKQRQQQMKTKRRRRRRGGGRDLCNAHFMNGRKTRMRMRVRERAREREWEYNSVIYVYIKFYVFGTVQFI